MGATTPTETSAHAARRGQLLKLASRVAAASAMVCAAAVSLVAHDPGVSALDVRVESQEIVAVLSLAAADARIAGGRDAMSGLVRDSIELALDGRSIPPSTMTISADGSGGLQARIGYRRPTGSRLVVRSKVVTHLTRGHRELLSIRTADGIVLAERMLDGGSNEAAADISALDAGTTPPFAQFFALGVRHILTGYDHLLFLAGVLVVLRRWRDVIQTVTAFTLAHSMTLALATAGLVAVPGRVVEPLIAASIVYVGIENLLRQAPTSRWKLTFGFGLIHGLGFATALRDVGVGAAGGTAIAVPLAAFNIGVEAGQMAVAAVLLPLFWRLASRPALRLHVAQAWSLLVVAAGSYWLIERVV